MISRAAPHPRTKAKLAKRKVSSRRIIGGHPILADRGVDSAPVGALGRAAFGAHAGQDLGPNVVHDHGPFGAYVLTRTAAFGFSADARPAHTSAHPRTSARIQAKLTVNAPGDRYKQEADRIADQVMRQGQSGGCRSSCTPGEGCDLHRAPEFSTSVKGGAGMAVPPALEAPIRSLQKGGEPLRGPILSRMETAFGQDLSHVRIHRSAAASGTARALGARAYTVGQHITFARGEYAPSTQAGGLLLAHELGHVMQQQSGSKDRVQRAPAGSRPRLPAAPNAYRGIDAYYMVGSLPRADFGDWDFVIRVGDYILGPNMLRTTPPSLVYYIAYRRSSKRNEWVVGPDSVERFIRGVNGFERVANATYAWVGTGQQIPAYQALSARFTRHLMAGDVRGSLSNLKAAWGSAVRDPGWWIQVITSAASGAARFPAAPRGTPSPPILRVAPSSGTTAAPAITGAARAAPVLATEGNLALAPRAAGSAAPVTAPRLTLVPAAKTAPTPAVTPLAPVITSVATASVAAIAPGSLAAPARHPDVDKPTEQVDEKGCRYTTIGQQFGRYPCHAKFATSLSGVRREVRVTTPFGLSADFDAMDHGGTLYEVKTGYRWVPFLPQSDPRRAGVEARFINQAATQSIIATTCGRGLRWYFNEKPAADHFDPLVMPPVFAVQYPCPPDSDD